jgi:NAD(P)-dependent dehydrogenase (short-subunit alcohol dehydrogenase family)
VDFENKTVVVTGVGRAGQVGEAVAQAFAERGALLALVDRTRANVEERAAALVAARHRATAHGCDLTNEAAVAALAREVGELADGRVDALVNLAGGFAASGPVGSTTPDVLQTQLAINLTTAFLATRALLPMLRQARGSIVYFGSVAALPGASGEGTGVYAAAKSGVLALMRAVAAEERANGVRANAVAPASIRTADNVAAMGDQARYVEREAVADAVVYLCSDAARAITGEVVRLG